MHVALNRDALPRHKGGRIAPGTDTRTCTGMISCTSMCAVIGVRKCRVANVACYTAVAHVAAPRPRAGGRG